MKAGAAAQRPTDPAAGLLGRGLLAVVAWYRDAVSPALPPRCRFYPTCSAYAMTALQRYGPARGSWLAARRILRCGPWHPGGVDHVPALPAAPDEAGCPRRRSTATPRGQGGAYRRRTATRRPRTIIGSASMRRRKALGRNSGR
ncbi:MAG: membrane protein insertion efficiency factor YidD [Geodermatophilaceae bacterium]